MYQERSSGGRGLVVVAVLIFVGVAMWWLESRFNATVAIMVIGSLVGAALVIIGFVLNMASTKYTLNSAAEFNRGLAETEKYRQLTQREVARGDSHWHKANAQISVLDAKRIDSLAQQRAGLLVDQQRQAQPPSDDFWGDEAHVRSRWGE